MKCPNCKNEVSPEWKICPNCEYKPRVCSKQGCESGWLPAVAHFCPQCGSPVKGEEHLGLKGIIERAVAAVSPTDSPDCSSPSSDCNELNFSVGGVPFKMIRVEGGSFLMGSTSEQGSDSYDDEKPAHRVSLDDYYIGETVVTQDLWRAVMGDNPSHFKGGSLPVEYVSWDDCQEFLKQLNRKTGKTFRLPTEAEWEYAARGGRKSQGLKYAGSNDIDEVAWYDGNSGNKTHPVKQKAANELGLYDMSGNVREWCQDWYAGSYSSSPQTNPTGPSSGSGRVSRGGGWFNFASTAAWRTVTASRLTTATAASASALSSSKMSC